MSNTKIIDIQGIEKMYHRHGIFTAADSQQDFFPWLDAAMLNQVIFKKIEHAQIYTVTD